MIGYIRSPWIEPPYHHQGTPWNLAPLPPRWHRCTAWSAGTPRATLLRRERCACGALREEGSPGWSLRNSRRPVAGAPARLLAALRAALCG